MATVSYVLDTTVLIDHLRDHAAATAWLLALPTRPMSSEVTRAEVIGGLRSSERASAERLFAAMDWIAVDEAVSRLAGDLGRRYRRSHVGLGTADLLIAATAIDQGAKMATSDVRHFPMFRGLKPPY